jgi:hypothetical protein
MRMQRTVLACLIAVMAALSTDAHAQKIFSRGPSPDVGRPVGPGGGGGFRGQGCRSPRDHHGSAARLYVCQSCR